MGKRWHYNQLFVVQARPETVQSQKQGNVLRSYRLLGTGQNSPLVTGRAVGEAISQGKVNLILDTNKIDQFQPGEVLVQIEQTPTGNQL